MERRRRAPGPQAHCREVVAHLPRPVAPARRVAETELAVRVGAPALHRTVVETGAGVACPHDHLQRTPAGAEPHGPQNASHLPGVVALRAGVAPAELARAVGTPALHDPADEEGAHVALVDGHLGDGGQGRHAHGGQVVAHLPRTVAPVARAPDAELAGGVQAPALQGCVVQPGAHGLATGQAENAASRPQVHRREVVAHLTGGVPPVVRVAVAQPAGGAVAPALHRGVVEEGAAVVAAGRHGRDTAARPEVDRRQVVAHLAGGVAPVIRGPQAQLAVGVAAPAFGRVVVQDGAGVVLPPRHVRRRPARPQTHGGEAVAHLTRAVAAVAGALDAQLAGVVPAPTLQRGVIEHGADVKAARADRGGAAPRPQAHR